jgi:hypothetical protein
MDWYLLSFTFRWPHEGMVLGFELFDPSEEQPYSTMRFHFLLVTLNYEFGSGDSPFGEI